MGHEPRFIRPTAPAADRAIVVGDPGRALTLAQDLIVKPPPMFNHHRGLWGYSGDALHDGGQLVVQGTGLGATSLNAVVTDLIGLGVSRFVRVGSCSSTGWLRAGDLLIAGQAVGLDGVSLALHPDSNTFFADSALAARLTSELAGAATVGAVESGDLGHVDLSEGRPSPETNPQAALETLATDLATASLFATAATHGAAAAAVLVVVRDAERELTDAETEAAARKAGAAAASALS